MKPILKNVILQITDTSFKHKNIITIFLDTIAHFKRGIN